MRRTTKVLVTLLLALGLAPVLSACGAGEESGSPTTTVQNVTVPTDTGGTADELSPNEEEDEDEGEEANGKALGKEKKEKDKHKDKGHANAKGHDDSSNGQGNDD